MAQKEPTDQTEAANACKPGYEVRGAAVRKALVALKLFPNYNKKRYTEIAAELLEAVRAGDDRLECGWVDVLKLHYCHSGQRKALEKEIGRIMKAKKTV
jgi:hypothetical protein